MSARRQTRDALIAAAAIVLVCAPVAAAQPAPVTPSAVPTTSAPFTTPNTDNCPHRTSPPKAIDLSEVPEPGGLAPTALPVPADPVGGKRLGGCGAITAPDTPPLPADISATGWVLADLDSGQVLAAKDPHGRYRPASTIKMLLALVALDELDLGKTVVATADDANAEGSSVGLGTGGRYTNRQLFQGLVMASGNDAAHAIAMQLGGVDAAVAKMNERARALGALDTRAATPSGLDGPGMSTSAYDLAVIFRAALRNQTFAELIHTETVQFPGFPKDPTNRDDRDHPPSTLSNDNQLLYNYDGALGGKTGYTDDARQTFAGAAERNGRRLAVTLLAGDVRPIRPPEQAARLLDYGFALPASTSVGELVEPDPATKAGDTGSTAGADADSTDRVSGTTVALIGGILIGAMLIAARRLQRRR